MAGFSLQDAVIRVLDLAPIDPTGRLKVDWFLIRSFVRRRYRDILNRTRWSFLLKTAAFTTTAPYKTGGITYTAGSATITGAALGGGTPAWTSALVGQYLFTANYPPLLISAVGGATSLTVETTMPITQSTAIGYYIAPWFYALASDVDYLLPNGVVIQWTLAPRSIRLFDEVDPYRQFTGPPLTYAFRGLQQPVTTTSQKQIELFPVSDQGYVTRYHYVLKAPEPTLATDPIYIPWIDALVWGALYECYVWLGGQIGSIGMTQAGAQFLEQYENLISEQIVRDEPLQNLPREVGLTWPLTISNDLLTKLGVPLPGVWM